jgi:ADP-ribose pyrophosphatase
VNEQVVFETPWFQLVAKRPPNWSQPHYSVRTNDYVCVVAVAPDEGLVLVRQFRPAVWETTLELPSGHVENGETPETAARRELLEETGFEAGPMRLLGRLAPDVGRLGNRLWCFHTNGLRRVADYQAEAGIETVLCTRSVRELLRDPEFNHALHLAPLLLALEQGCLTFDSWEERP